MLAAVSLKGGYYAMLSRNQFSHAHFFVVALSAGMEQRNRGQDLAAQAIMSRPLHSQAIIHLNRSTSATCFLLKKTKHSSPDVRNMGNKDTAGPLPGQGRKLV